MRTLLALICLSCWLPAAVSWSLPYFEPPTSASGTIYDVGPGKAYAEPSDVPWLSLAAGDVVRIHYRSQPYRAILGIRTQGTSMAPLRIYGVRDPATGSIPTISADGAVTTSSALTAHLAPLRGGQLIAIIDYGGRMPSHIEIANLELRDARHSSTFTDTTGSANYGGFPCAIWSRAKHLTIKGCRFADNGIGVFTQCNTGIAGSSEDTLIDGCDFSGNGNTGRSTEHNIYTQGVGATIQFCRIGRLIGPGSAIKDRSAGTIIRYNLITATARALDLVEVEGDLDSGIEEIVALPSYGQDYVYGNIIINDMIAGGSGRMIHYGADNEYSRTRKGILRFYNNTVAIQSGMTYTDPYRDLATWSVSLFQISADEGRVEAYNNIMAMLEPITPPGIWGPSGLNLHDGGAGAVHGTVDFGGGNWIRTSWATAHDDYPTIEPGGHVVQSAALIAGDDPGFVDRLVDPTLTASSGCRGIGVPLPAAILGVHPVLYQCGAPPTARPSSFDSGAFEGAAAPGIAITRHAIAIPDGSEDAIASSVVGAPLLLTYTIANAGGDTLTVGGVSVAPGPNCSTSITTAPSSSIAVGASSSLSIAVTPAATGAWSFTVSFSTNVAGRNPNDWTVSGTAMTPSPEITVSRGADVVGNHDEDAIAGSVVGDGMALDYTIANSGSAPLTIGSVSTASANNCTAVITVSAVSPVAAGGSTSLGLTVTPISAGAWSFEVSFTTDDGDENPTGWTVSGIASDPGHGGGRGDDDGSGGGGGGCGAGAVALLAAPLLLSLRRRRSSR